MKNWYEKSEIPEHLMQYFERIEMPVTPCVILDPFHGSGTTGVVALREGRSYCGVDISCEYLDDVTQQRMGGGMQIGMAI